MDFLPERKYKTKAICGLSKHQLFEKLTTAIQNYRLKTAIEATTYIHHSGYDREWWDTIFSILLKSTHVHAFGHYKTIYNFYEQYTFQKQNNDNVATNRTIGWHMCLITTMMTIFEKTPILSQKQLKSLLFLQFAMYEGTTRPSKLRVIHDNIMNCMEDILETTDYNEVTQLTHYILREDYGHNKYVPILFDKLLENATIQKIPDLTAIKNLYACVPGNKRYLCVLIGVYMYFADNYSVMELGRYEQQAQYYYQQNLKKIREYYENKTIEPVRYAAPMINNIQQLTTRKPEIHYEVQREPIDSTQPAQVNLFEPRAPDSQHPPTVNHVIPTENNCAPIEEYIFEPRQTENESEHTSNIPEIMQEYNQDSEPELEPEPEAEAEPVHYGRKPFIKIIKM